MRVSFYDKKRKEKKLVPSSNYCNDFIIFFDNIYIYIFFVKV